MHKSSQHFSHHTSQHLIGQRIKRLPWADVNLLVIISSPRLISHTDLRCHWSTHLIVIVRVAVGVCREFSGPRLIGWWCVLTSRPCQLIGVRSRFEERSWTEERDRGGSPEEQRAASSSGWDRPAGYSDRTVFPFLFFKALDNYQRTKDTKPTVFVRVQLAGLRVSSKPLELSEKKKLIES